jgi:ketosteroid isomerase-like protein
MEGAANFEEAERIVRRVTEALNRGDLDAAEALFAEDVEWITRDGPARGPKVLRDIWAPQLERFDVKFEVERIVDAGDCRVILVQKVDRRDPETGEVELRAWPALVIRVQDGKVVFVEGYPDRRKAFTDLGLEPEP